MVRFASVRTFIALVAALAIAGCAAAPASSGGAGGKQVAKAKKPVYCQTDDDTGSRLSHHTTCTDDQDTDASSALRGIQSRGAQGEVLKGN